MKYSEAAGPPSGAPGRSLTVREAAAWLDLSEDALRRMMRAGRIEWFQTGEKYGYRIPASAVERRLALQDGAPGGPGGAATNGRAPRVAQLGLRVRALRDELEGIAQELRGFAERLRRLDDDLAEALEDGR